MTSPSPGASLDVRTDPWLLAALMAAVAVIGAALFALSPLLPDIARDLGVPIAQAGRLPAIYSFSLAVSAPAIALAARDWSRARVLSGALLTFGLAWCAPLLLRSYEAMMAVTLLAGASAGAAQPDQRAVEALVHGGQCAPVGHARIAMPSSPRPDAGGLKSKDGTEPGSNHGGASCIVSTGPQREQDGSGEVFMMQKRGVQG